MKNKKKLLDRDIFRIRFPEDEGKHPWLPMLLDAYAVIDEGVATALQKEKRKSGRLPVCQAGCSNCCRFQNDIAVYPVELVGIYWYVVEKIEGESRETLKQQLSSHDRRPPCPFLVRNRCSIYPVRPMACRQFIVFTKPCAAGEDPFFSRRIDVLMPLQEYAEKAVFLILPFFGMQDASERKKAAKTGLLHAHFRNLQTSNWKTLAERMTEFDVSCSQ